MIRSVMITGASSGIGAACALHLDGLGLAVFAGVRRDQDGEALRRRASDRLRSVLIDVTDDESVAQAAETVGDVVGEAGLAGLVNNAGLAIAGPLEALPLAEVRRQMEVNVFGQVAVTQAFLPLLRKCTGRVVNMGSISGKVAMPLLGPYAASKFALEALTDSLRLELAAWGLHVAIIEPGTVATPIWERSGKQFDAMVEALPDEARARYRPLIDGMLRAVEKATAKAASPDKVARAVAHALTAHRPKTRYTVGRDAKLMALLLRPLPDRIRDRLILLSLGVRRA